MVGHSKYSKSCFYPSVQYWWLRIGHRYYSRCAARSWKEDASLLGNKRLCSYQANKIFTIENTVLLLGYLPLLLSFFLGSKETLVCYRASLVSSSCIIQMQVFRLCHDHHHQQEHHDQVRRSHVQQQAAKLGGARSGQVSSAQGWKYDKIFEGWKYDKTRSNFHRKSRLVTRIDRILANLIVASTGNEKIPNCFLVEKVGKIVCGENWQTNGKKRAKILAITSCTMRSKYFLSWNCTLAKHRAKNEIAQMKTCMLLYLKKNARIESSQISIFHMTKQQYVTEGNVCLLLLYSRVWIESEHVLITRHH